MLRGRVLFNSSHDTEASDPINRPPHASDVTREASSVVNSIDEDNVSVGTFGTHHTLRQHNKWRRKITKLLESSNADQQHEQARRAGHVAAEQFWRMALDQSVDSSHRELLHASFLCDTASVESVLDEDPFQQSHSARSFSSRGESGRNSFSSHQAGGDEGKSMGEQSSERAMLRGIRRGKRENNESKNGKRKTHGFSNDGMSLTHAETISSSPLINRKGKKNNHSAGRMFGRNQKQGTPGSKPFMGGFNTYMGSLDEEDADAWMCGVCGKAFATLEAADKHEQDHIERVINGLPWMRASTADQEANASLNRRSTRAKTSALVNGEKEKSNKSRLGRQSVQPPAIRSIPIATGVMDEIAEDEDEKNQDTQGQPYQTPERLPSDLLEEVLEEEKQEIDPVDKQDSHEGDYWLDNEGSFGEDMLKPRLRSEARFHQEDVPHRIDPLLGQPNGDEEPQEALLLSSAVRDYVILADEALVSVCEKARNKILSPDEVDAERSLAYLASDKAYYDDLMRRAGYRKSPHNRNRSEGHGIVGKVQNKFLDAYQLMKEGTDKKGFRDEYNARSKKNASVQDQKLVTHNQKTLYLNVMVKNGIQVVKNELERLAKERWENTDEIDKYTRFERFRVYAHMNMVRLAGLALSSDFTPRRIAVQLSNDIYRLLTPRLKRRGVAIETEIEYRVGPYFVLAVNVQRIDWRRLIKATHRDVILRRERWEQQSQEHDNNEGAEPQKQPSAFTKWKEYFMHVLSLTQYDIVAQILSWLYLYTHWVIYQPFCIVCYYTFFGAIVRQFILSSVADEIFYYVEEKGMEMNIAICHASLQAAFMLAALREIRADSKDHRKKEQQTATEGKLNILGPMLGPAIPADKGVVEPPPGFEVPEHLEYLGLELDVPVGFRRLRWALLSTKSEFLTEALYRVEAKYENITMGAWSRHNENIGSPKTPDGINEEEFIGAQKEGSYLMPKSAFVKANMCSETHQIVAYNDYCFTLKKKALTPEVPYGSTFVAWTQFTVINTGNDSCRLQFSVEPEFPNGPPMISRQIKSGMRAGVGELFVLIGETIAKYADEYP